jgi:hypothetical protein
LLKETRQRLDPKWQPVPTTRQPLPTTPRPLPPVN